MGKPVTVSPDATLLALGGASWPRLGTDGSWAKILEAREVDINPLQPANCGFAVEWSEYFRERFAGQPLKPLALTFENHTRQGEAMVTANGLEGSAIYAMSAPLRTAIADHGSAELRLDLRPGVSVEALTKKLQAPRGSKSLSSHLRGAAGLSPLAVALLREVTSADVLATYTAAAMAARLKSLPLKLTGTSGLARAISTAGGVTQAAVDDHLMLRALPGVFVAGEMLDWEAPTGGYLLQACFSTAHAAAEGIKRYCKA